MKKSYKISITALLASFATIAFIIENLFPPLFITGARMGVSNIFIILALITFGYKNAYFVLLVKVLLGSLFSGNISAIIYSLPSGIIALTIEIIIFYKSTKISITACSILGAVVNTTLQNITFCLITQTTNFLVYIPYLALIGIISGAIVGFTVYLINKILPNSFLENIR